MLYKLIAVQGRSGVHWMRVNREIRRVLITVCCIAGGSWFTPALADEFDALILGVFPRRAPSEMVEMFHPMAVYLSRKIGRQVKLETTTTFAEFGKAIANKRYHIIHLNQMQYVRAHQFYGYQVFAMNEEAGRSTLRGALIVRKDSGITSLADLRGKSIIFGGREAFTAYTLPSHQLRREGLTVADYKEEFAITPSNVPLAVYYHQADAGGAGDMVLEMPWLNDKIDVNELMILDVGEHMPHLPWAASSDLSVDWYNKIRTALITIKKTQEGEAVLKAATLTNIVPARDSDYNVVRKLLKKVTSER